MPKFDIITIGGATRDFFISTDKGTIIDNKKNLKERKLLAFEYGAKIYLQGLDSSLGGGACNTAVGFSRLKLKTAIKVCINEKREGDWIKKTLKKEKVDTSLIENNTEEPSGFSFIVVAGNTKTRDHVAFSYRGSNKYLKISANEKLNSKWIYLTSFSGDNWEQQLKNITNIVKKQKIKLAFNPGSRQLEGGFTKLKNILKVTEVLLVNRDEAMELVLSKQHYNQAPHIDTLLRELGKYCPNTVVITDGSKGAYACHDREFYFKKAIKIDAIDTTGSGDAFGSGFVAGFIKGGGDIKKGLEMGVKNGASVAKNFGPQEGLLRKF